MLNITELTCRVCLEEHNILINIYDELEELHTNLSNLLDTCADLQINENDIFPKYLCEDCTRELLIALRFREKCVKSKEVLCEILKNTKMVTNDNYCSLDDIEYYTEEVNNVEMEDINEDVEVQETMLIREIEKPEIQYFSLSLLKKNIESSKSSKTPYIVSSENFTQEVNNTNQKKFGSQESVVEVLSSKPLEWDDSDLVEHVESVNLTRPFNAKFKRNHLYKCDICGAMFKQAINLQKHLQKSHDPENRYICSKCDHWFSLEIEFSKHVENCNNKEVYKDNLEDKKIKTDEIFSSSLDQEKNRKCVYCERDFPTPFALRMHLRTHTGERPFKCKYCTKSFKTQSHLNVHHKRHTGQADFICTICNKRFYEQSNLTVHIRSHTGERPHTCAVCNKTFTRVFLLKFHMRTHTGEKPLKCDNNFRQHADLRSHLTIHTGQMQYSCVLCCKSFIKRSQLTQHMRKHKIYSDDKESAEMDQLKSTHIINEENIASNQMQNNILNSEILCSFDEIIECKDLILQ